MEKGAVIQEPKGPTSTSQFELSSIPATIHNLFNLSLFLTKRDEWAGSFDELLLDAPRDDAPMHLPDPPAPAKPWTPAPPLNMTEEVHPPAAAAAAAGGSEGGVGGGGPVPQHCGREDGVCRGSDRESVQQRRRMEWIAHRSGIAAPTGELTHVEAHAWLTEQWEQLLLLVPAASADDEGPPPGQ